MTTSLAFCFASRRASVQCGAMAARSRFAPVPDPARLKLREQTFILDCVAVGSIAEDFSRSLPKLGSVIPPYNAQADRHAIGYFSSKPVPTVLRRTGQSKGGTSILGPLADRFNHHGAACLYLRKRNAEGGTGYSSEVRDGHGHFLASLRPVFGYNGLYGFRRNTPTLRRLPSPFGTSQLVPLH
ncbi:uncharacterized protein C17orf98-like [Erpetoichthys calabaricus]|uniref:uncharacterized protein C17orf98-like n=1 Tax=Erpetoichthys calabaricus TaxID=27687 RepID=UPI0022345ED1|nr:uncharacterized protein C17orf98-like [Erpetoichthys calabaricus]